MLVRPATDDDDLDAIHAGDDLWIGAALFRRFGDALASSSEVRAWCVEIDGRAVGHAYAAYRTVRTAGQFGGYLWVQPGSRRLGCGRALREAVVGRARELGFDHWLTSASDADPDGPAVAQHWGGRDDGYHFESSLDLTSLTDDLVDRLSRKAIEAGVVLEAPADDAALRDLMPFIVARDAEAPDSGEEHAPPTWEMLRAMTGPEEVLIATHDGVPVGVTFWLDREDLVATAHTGFTGVEPSWRGHGIATALKAESARRMRDRGWQTLRTENMRGNDHILAANDRLGFVRLRGYYDFSLPL